MTEESSLVPSVPGLKRTVIPMNTSGAAIRNATARSSRNVVGCLEMPLADSPHVQGVGAFPLF